MVLMTVQETIKYQVMTVYARTFTIIMICFDAMFCNKICKTIPIIYWHSGVMVNSCAG